MLDHGEFARWLEASDDEAGLASQLVDLEAFNAVVLHSEQAAQLVLKGMLRGVGAGSQCLRSCTLGTRRAGRCSRGSRAVGRSKSVSKSDLQTRSETSETL
jgi:hypothetical protein